MNITKRTAAVLIAVTLPLVAAAPAAVAAPTTTSSASVAVVKAKKPPLVKMLLTQNEIAELMMWVSEVATVQGPAKEGKNSSLVLTGGVNNRQEKQFAGAAVELFGGSDKRFDREAKKVLRELGLNVTDGVDGYSWSGQGISKAKNSFQFVTVLNLGKGISCTAVVFTGLEDSELAKTSSALSARLLASKQAEKVNKFGYGIFGSL
jgi:hypothetical protein